MGVCVMGRRFFFGSSTHDRIACVFIIFIVLFFIDLRILNCWYNFFVFSLCKLNVGYYPLTLNHSIKYRHSEIYVPYRCFRGFKLNFELTHVTDTHTHHSGSF